jgi:hypothetical protein
MSQRKRIQAPLAKRVAPPSLRLLDVVVVQFIPRVDQED